MTPIVGAVIDDQPLWGDAVVRRPMRGRTYSTVGVRAEQLRRAAILQKAAKGAAITKGNAAYVVERLARVVPGMRYRVGSLVYSTLAPASPELYAPRGDGLPGRTVGRPRAWNAARRAALVAWVDARMREADAPTQGAALTAYGDALAAAGEFPPSVKTLANQLAEGKREARAVVTPVIPTPS